MSFRILAFILFSVSVASDALAEREWQFRVLLDGSEIGSHSFELREEGDRKRLVSEARFDIKFLFFTAYRYRHTNTEEWSDDCLVEIDARTVRNGDTLDVEGRKSGESFVVQRPGETVELPACIMTFAYWNPGFLDEPKLLNPQTGEFLDVTVEELPVETLTVRGESREARRYRVVAKDMELELWYSQDSEWLALESTVKGGRVIRYELT